MLRVAHRRRSEYEWVQHMVLAGDAGITPDEVERVQPRRRPGRPTAGRRSMPPWCAAADELIDDARVSDATWAVLAAELDQQQLMDVVFTVGAYDLLAMAFRTFDVELDEDLLDWVDRTAAATDGNALLLFEIPATMSGQARSAKTDGRT